MSHQLNPSDLTDDAVILDVREQNEWDAGHAANAIHIPLGELPARFGELPEVDEADPLPVICRAGGRSARAVAWLTQQGYDAVNVDGGMQGWQAAGKAMTTDDGSDATVI
ncbi:rhodanese-like domain-containing protein [Rudaeicoccus suwonensis]|uniref:Rhodanese-related sulfurtransferase n=1 Tax=Rudaeicoccus suwonensis TaxID=657409 RepID=A0A561E4B3_9MICO|nr:rhodanese-like domain-containing protein [Rudaeicoccus suwonensis]TWE10452.1 rhodanese-related sulfurtransferase [Rudaeicoccus suwonensis]